MGRVSRRVNQLPSAACAGTAVCLSQPDAHAEPVALIAGAISVVTVTVAWRVCVPVDDIRTRVPRRIVLIRIVRLGISVRIILSRVIRLGIRSVSITVSRAPLVRHIRPGLVDYDPASRWPGDYPSPLRKTSNRENHQHEKGYQRRPS